MAVDLSGIGPPPISHYPAPPVVKNFSRHRLLGAGSVNNTLVKAGPALLISATLVNTSASVRFVKFVDKATTPAAGTDTPTETIQLPVTSTVQLNWPLGAPFTLGLGYWTCNLVADSDATAITAADVIVQLQYI